MAGPIRRLFILTGAAVAGFIPGCISGCLTGLNSRPEDQSHLAEYYPLPHHVPKYPAGLSFRFAMAHDVIHERYPKHGPAFHRERERLTREKLAKLDPDDKATFPLADDLASALWGHG